MIQERVSGIRNRAIVAGVKNHQILISHLIEGFIIMFFQVIQTVFYFLTFLFPTLTWKSTVLFVLILFLTGIAGIVFGVFVSVINDSVETSIHSNQAFVTICTFICGLWLLNLILVSIFTN